MGPLFIIYNFLNFFFFFSLLLGVSVQITAPMVETTSLSVPGNKTDYKIQIKSLQFSLFDEVEGLLMFKTDI